MTNLHHTITNQMVPTPNLFIIGPPRTATTSLSYWLNQHPDFFLSQPKESNFITHEYENGLNYYLYKYFRHWDGQSVICDAHPMHAVVGYAADRIKAISPSAKILVIVRNAYERAFSEWRNWNSMRPGRSHKTFDDAIFANIKCFSHNKFALEGDYVPYCDSKGGCYIPSYIEGGMYWTMISRYVDLFTPENIGVIYYGDLISNKSDVIARIFNWLNIGQTSTAIKTDKVNMSGSFAQVDEGDVVAMLSESNYDFLFDKFNSDANLQHSLNGKITYI